MELVSEALTCASLQRALGSALSQNHSVCDIKDVHTSLRIIRYVMKLKHRKENLH